MEKFGDPTFEYHETFVKLCGLLVVRLSDDRLLPLYPRDYSFAIQQYLDNLPLYETNEMLGSIYKPLFKSVKKLKKKTRRFERRRARLDERLKEFDNLKDAELPSVIAKRLARTNKRIMYFERAFIQDDETNVMGQRWFKHVIYAPSLDQGTTATTLPAITEALVESNGDTEQLVHAIQRTSHGIYAAVEALKADYDDDNDDDDDSDDSDDDDDIVD